MSYNNNTQNKSRIQALILTFVMIILSLFAGAEGTSAYALKKTKTDTAPSISTQVNAAIFFKYLLIVSFFPHFSLPLSFLSLFTFIFFMN